MSLTDPLMPLGAVVDQLRQHLREETVAYSPPLTREIARLVAMYDEDQAAIGAFLRYTTIGCPKCGAEADQFCVSAQGRPQDFTYGNPYFHADRRRLVDTMGVPTVGDAQ